VKIYSVLYLLGIEAPPSNVHTMQIIDNHSTILHNYHVPENTPPKVDDDDVEPLSIMYEILQRWDKSLAVFEEALSMRLLSV